MSADCRGPINTIVVVKHNTHMADPALPPTFLQTSMTNLAGITWGGSVSDGIKAEHAFKWGYGKGLCAANACLSFWFGS